MVVLYKRASKMRLGIPGSLPGLHEEATLINKHTRVNTVDRRQRCCRYFHKRHPSTAPAGEGTAHSSSGVGAAPPAPPAPRRYNPYDKLLPLHRQFSGLVDFPLL